MCMHSSQQLAVCVFSSLTAQLHLCWFNMETIFVYSCLLSVALGQNAEINVKGFEGRDVLFRCSHKLAFKNNKYFCTRSCKDEDILATVASGHRAESGRITLMDLGNGAFDVKISRLQLSDSSFYWCAVERPGLDTYTSVYLTVIKAAVTTLIPDVSSTWTENISTLSSNDGKTSKPTNFLTTKDFTANEQRISPSIKLIAVAVPGATLFILILATVLFRKPREMLKPPSNAGDCTNHSSTHNRKETECVPKEVNWDKIFSGITPVHKEQDPNQFGLTKANYDMPQRIYENVGFINGNKGTTCPAAGQQNQDLSSRIYITLLPSSGRTADSLSGPQTRTAAPQNVYAEETVTSL